MATWQLPADLTLLISLLSGPLHARVAERLLPLITGMLFAQGRRTVSSWLRGAGVGDDFRKYYYFLGSLGRKIEWVASVLLQQLVARLPLGDRLLFAIDDTPTKRYGPYVEGAGIHHNPTPGPADQKFLYGHIWVTIAWMLRHPSWGTIGLPLRALMYVRRKDAPPLKTLYGVSFQTKLEMAGTLIAWLAQWLRFLGKPLWVVADGAYAKRPVFRAAQKAGGILVSRLRKDAALWSVPLPAQAGQRKRRGRPRTYGNQRLSLAKRAAHQRGWQTQVVTVYRQEVVKTFKTFLATYKPAGGLIRVVLVREPDGWIAYLCTQPTATVVEILEAVADRSAIEQDFHDIKEVHGAGQQQVRHYWASVAVYHLNLWLYTLIELWAWKQPHTRLCDRRSSPWDNPDRRPSHADRRNALRRHCVGDEFRAAAALKPLPAKIHAMFRRLLKLVA
jgi:DDE superfamily endonuclease